MRIRLGMADSGRNGVRLVLPRALRLHTDPLHRVVRPIAPGSLEGLQGPHASNQQGRLIGRADAQLLLASCPGKAEAIKVRAHT